MPYEEDAPATQPDPTGAPQEEVLAPAAQEPVTQPVKRSAPERRSPRWLWGGKIGPAFWTVASLVSMAVNVALIIILVILGQQLFMLKSLVQDQLIGGLYTNFQKMDAAHIRTQIPVSTEVPAKFDLPLSTVTDVKLTQDVTINNVTIANLNAGALYISSAQATITLPKDTVLPVALNLTVPVDQKIPVDLMVDVDIPLNQTELHPPFVGLQDVVKPYYTLLSDLPNSWQAVICSVQPGLESCSP